MEASQTYIDTNTELIQLIADQWDDGLFALWLIAKILTPLTVVTSWSNRLNIDVNNVLGTIAQVTLVPTVTTVGTVNTVGNQNNMWWLSAFDMQYNLGHMAYANAIGNFQ